MSTRLISALLLAASCTAACGHKQTENAEWLGIQPAPPIDGLDVTRGTPYRLSDERGKVVLLSFGYTSCLELCPDTFATVRRVLAALGSRAQQVEFAYVTVDPERDRPPAFASFLASVDRRFHGIYLEGDALRSVLSGYHVTVRKRVPDPEGYAQRKVDPAAFYTMDHSAGFWLIDPAGNLRVRFNHATSDREIVSGIAELLARQS